MTEIFSAGVVAAAAALGITPARYLDPADLPGEEWADIPQAPGHCVSCIGRVRSDARARRPRTIIRKPRLDRKGYLILGAGQRPVRATLKVHHLVLAAFVADRPRGLETRHLDRNPANNCAYNLDVGTAQDNADDRKRHGTTRLGFFCRGGAQGERNSRAKLTDAAVREIRASREPTKVLAARYGVVPDVIRNVRKRAAWAHVL